MTFDTRKEKKNDWIELWKIHLAMIFFYPLDLAKDSIMSDLGNHRLLKQ